MTTEIARTWLSGNSSCTLVIPKGLAQKHGIYKPSEVVIEDTDNGLFLRKLELK